MVKENSQKFDFETDFSCHSLNPDEVLDKLNVKQKQGLSVQEAQTRLQQVGKNELQEEEGESIWEKLIEQFDDPMVKLLLIAAFISLGISYFSQGHGQEEDLPIWIEPFVIFLILIANGLIGLYQDYSAEKSMETLKNLMSRECTVLRNGEWTHMDTTLLVPGDIVKVVMGKVVPADLRIIKINSYSLSMNQSILTGETASVQKQSSKSQSNITDISDKNNMLFSGTTCVFGSAICVVYKTGDHTFIGKVNEELKLASEEKKLSPLKEQLNNFGNVLAISIAVICLIIWALSIPHFFDNYHGNWLLTSLYYFKQAVALGVAAIPEGLPAVITTCLALGTRRMIKRNALVRKLPVVETLGCTTVICSDKTGTLTKNEMLTCKYGIFNKTNTMIYSNATGEPYSPEGQVELDSTLDKQTQNINLLSLNCLMNNESSIYKDNDGVYHSKGMPTEASLIAFAQKLNCKKLAKNLEAETIFTLHFTSKRKMMSTLVRLNKEKNNLLLTKGAAEYVLDRCTDFLNSKNEKIAMNS